MKKRSVAAVLLLPFVTLGIYSIYWYVKTKGEMNEKGNNIPTAWLMIVPFVGIWWLWKYSEAVENVTGGKMSAVLSFVMLWLLGWIGQAILQDAFNNLETVPVESAAPMGMSVPVADAESTETTPVAPEASATTPEVTASDDTTTTPPTPTVSG